MYMHNIRWNGEFQTTVATAVPVPAAGASTSPALPLGCTLAESGECRLGTHLVPSGR